MYKNLSEKPIADLQNEQAEQWENEDLLEQCVNTRSENDSFIFYEGPPTANGKPGIHHVISRTLKDSVCRHKTMEGYQVKRKAGWDTHGLPVEIEVEKELNLFTKKDIEEYGIKEFNEKCRESVFKYENMWREMSKRMGFLIDMDDPYITLDNNYIESVWWILKEFFEEDFIYEGHKVLPYCPRCGTGLASHEVALGYKEVKTNTLTAMFKRKNADEYFLAWTTTPWTLAANTSLTVGSDIEYIRAKMKDSSDHAGVIVYVAGELADKVLGEGNYETLDTMKGRDLEHIEYEQLMPFVKSDKKAFFITLGDYVTTEDGTGIVHTAPAFGEDDYNTGRKYDLPVLNPVDEDGKYTQTPWAGRFVMEDGLDVDIIKWLAGEGKLFSKEKVVHNYPHCWRCGTPLIYYSKPSWYIEMTKLKDKLVANNDKVDWHPDFIGEKRFGNWLENVNDWAISRNRYWGTPIPIWRCSDCGKLKCIGSRKELAENSIEKIDESIELHRPYVDDVHVKCEECGSSMDRIPEVIDCWFDSGSMTFAQHHYPFENYDLFDKEMFPADFICEGIDQTRGWFYSLIAISTFIKGTSPYKNVLVNDLILDKNGKKMSKSKGNTVDPFELFDKYGADAVRWYLLYTSPVWVPTKFDEDGLIEISSKFFGTLKNVYQFFVLYSNQDKINPADFDLDYDSRPELDRWILSKYNRLARDVIQDMDDYDHMKAVRKIQNFVIEDLSNWYIRRARRRFWAKGLSEDKKSVYSATYEIMMGVVRLAAPLAPFITDEIYRNLGDGNTVHLAYYPEYNEDLLDDRLEEKMDLVRDLVGLGRGVREKERIKVRQPLMSVIIDGKYEELISDMTGLIKDELNIKEVIFEKDLGKYMDFNLKPNFKEAGPRFGAEIKGFAKTLAEADSGKVLEALETGDAEVGGFKFDDSLIDVQISAKEGFAAAMERNLFTILDTTITPELAGEGIVREFISKVQQLRKQTGLEMMDNIEIYFYGDDEVTGAVDEYRQYISDETLAKEIKEMKDAFEEYDINGHKVGINIKKI